MLHCAKESTVEKRIEHIRQAIVEDIHQEALPDDALYAGHDHGRGETE